MSIDKYRTFLAAARRGTFFETAEELYITPATVSKQIAALEKEMGVVLFTRLPHGVSLTPEGEDRLMLIRQMVETYDALMDRPSSDEDQRLVVYAAPPPSRFNLKAIMDEFREERSDIHLEIHEKRGVSKAVITGECELGFIGGKHLDPARLQWIPVMNNRLGAVLPKNHPLASRESISLYELRAERFVFPNPEIGVHQEYLEMCRRSGFSPNIACFGFRDDSILFYVSCGVGVALFTRQMMDMFNYPDTVFVPIDEELYTHGVLAKAKTRALSTNASVFWNFIKKNYVI